MGRQPPQYPPRMISAVKIVQAMKRIIVRITVTIDGIVDKTNPSTATFDRVVTPYAAVNNSIQDEIGVIFMLQYALLDKVTQEESLDPESKLLLNEMLLDFEECGLGEMGDDEMHKYLHNSAEIDDLVVKFQRNIAYDDNGLWLQESDLNGVPDETAMKWKTKMNNSGSPRKFVSFANGGTSTLLSHARATEVRRAIFEGDHNNLPENDSLLKEIIVKRYEQAVRLGYQSHAAFRARRRLLKSPGAIRNFLENLKPDLISLGKADVDTLRSLERKDNLKASRDKNDMLPAWDQPYYSRLLEEQLHIDHMRISEYFPLDHTAEAMLGVISSLLGLHFNPIKQAELGSEYFWHESVRAFAVWESGYTAFVGYLFFDLLWRENKYRGNQNVTHLCGYEESNGSRCCPSTILMCSFPTASAGRPVLLKHREVVTLFHELGHGIHNLVSKTKYARFHGTNLPPDFGEMPSILLENYCWMPDVLERLSCHYTNLKSKYLSDWRACHPHTPIPPREIPRELVDPLIRNRYINRASYHLKQLSISLFDLEIHSVESSAEAKDLNLRNLFYSLREDCEGVSFGNLRRTGSWYGIIPHLTGGYDVGYYSYLVCTAFAQDIFEMAFSKNPWDRRIWDAFRFDILQHGGEHPDMMMMLRDFLGRPLTPQVMVKALKSAATQLIHEP
ncbi:hypothetical protein LZL87_013491 [Fusarium oxysporum]|nr:hypothetical protein LZL87_013491 [Fusarium oxysporum]